MSLAILIPMLGRAQRVRPLVESIRTTTPTARVLFLTTPTDSEVRTTIDALGCERVDVDYAPGDYSRKIHVGYQHTTERLLFTGAVDLLFHPGWFDACVRRLNPGIGVVGTNDLTNKRTIRGRHSTHSLVTRDYADLGTIDGQPGPLFQGYHHSFCDDELVATARKRGAWIHATDAKVEHLHPMARKVPDDEIYELGRSHFEEDRQLFKERCSTHGM